jgi:type II secretory pathway pseudopilin PulG
MPLNETVYDDMNDEGPSRAKRRPRGYLMLEVIVSGVILATALMGAMVTTQRANTVMAEASRESQAAQVLAKSLSAFLAEPYGRPIPFGASGETISVGSMFRCRREWTTTLSNEITHGANFVQVELISITIKFNLPNGVEREVKASARRYNLV